MSCTVSNRSYQFSDNEVDARMHSQFIKLHYLLSNAKIKEICVHFEPAGRICGFSRDGLFSYSQSGLGLSLKL